MTVINMRPYVGLKFELRGRKGTIKKLVWKEGRETYLLLEFDDGKRRYLREEYWDEVKITSFGKPVKKKRVYDPIAPRPIKEVLRKGMT